MPEEKLFATKKQGRKWPCGKKMERVSKNIVGSFLSIALKEVKRPAPLTTSIEFTYYLISITN